MVVVIGVLIMFGSKKIPDFAKGLGQGIKEFKKASREVTDEIQNAAEQPPSPSPNRQPAPTLSAQSQVEREWQRKQGTEAPPSAPVNPPSTVPKT